MRSITALKKNNQLFLQLVLNAQAREGNTGNFLSCKPFPYPPVISLNGLLRSGKKSDNIKVLLEHQMSSKHSSPEVQVKIFDAAALFQSLRSPESSKTFNQYKKYFWNHVKTLSVNCCRVDLVFDCYLKDSLKSIIRTNVGHR